MYGMLKKHTVENIKQWINKKKMVIHRKKNFFVVFNRNDENLRKLHSNNDRNKSNNCEKSVQNH